MKVYLNDEKSPVDPGPLYDILWGLKALCDIVAGYTKRYFQMEYFLPYQLLRE